MRNLDELSDVEDLAQEGHPGVAGRAVLSHLAYQRNCMSCFWGQQASNRSGFVLKKRKCARALDLSRRVVPRLDDHMGVDLCFFLLRRTPGQAKKSRLRSC